MRIIYTIFATLIIFTTVLQSKSGFVSQIPNGSKYSCATCHPNGNYGQLNDFGKATKLYLSGGKINWVEALALLDSDGDGFSNGVELQDPHGTWKQGDPAPGELSLVTNPGDANSFPNENYVEDFGKVSGMIIKSVYPNPVRERAVIDISFSVAGYFKLELYNYAGLQMCMLEAGYYQPGIYSINLKTLGYLNTGEYFLNFNFNGYQRLEKILIIK
jgi:hypothetical protein